VRSEWSPEELVESWTVLGDHRTAPLVRSEARGRLRPATIQRRLAQLDAPCMADGDDLGAGCTSTLALGSDRRLIRKTFGLCDCGPCVLSPGRDSSVAGCLDVGQWAHVDIESVELGDGG
jgi:hypothetical protein